MLWGGKQAVRWQEKAFLQTFSHQPVYLLADDKYKLEKE